VYCAKGWADSVKAAYVDDIRSEVFLYGEMGHPIGAATPDNVQLELFEDYPSMMRDVVQNSYASLYGGDNPVIPLQGEDLDKAADRLTDVFKNMVDESLSSFKTVNDNLVAKNGDYQGGSVDTQNMQTKWAAMVDDAVGGNNKKPVNDNYVEDKVKIEEKQSNQDDDEENRRLRSFGNCIILQFM